MNNDENKEEIIHTPMTALDHYVTLGRSGLRVSPLNLGAMTFGSNQIDGWNFGEGEEESKKVFDAYYEAGGNFIDTANVYASGNSERLVGSFISQRRSNVVIATKYSACFSSGHNPNIGGNSRKSLVENLDASLKRMGIGCIDLFYLHVWEYRTSIEDVMRALDDVIRSGKAYYCGISDTPAWVVSRGQTLAQLNGWSPFIALQTRYNMLDRSMEGEFWPMCSELGLSTITWGTVAEGFLSGKYKREDLNETVGTRSRIKGHMSKEKNWEILDVVKEVANECNKSPIQVALNWTIRKGVTSPLIGARNEKQIRENIDALSFTLTDEQFERLDNISTPELNFPHIGRGGFVDGGYNVIKQKFF